MKKFLCLFLALIMCLSLCACNGGENAPETTPEPIQLTTENISNYLEIRGSYTTTGCAKGFGVRWVTYADLDFQAYSVVSGTLENVEITIEIQSENEDDAWWLVGSKNSDDSKDGHRITISFRMPTTGSFESTYSIGCRRKYESSLSGDCDFKIVSASGTFTPNK